MLTVMLFEKRWRAEALRAIGSNLEWRLVASGRAARRLARLLPKLLAEEKLGFIDFLSLAALRAFPSVFFYAKGKGFCIRQSAPNEQERVALEFIPPKAGTRSAVREWEAPPERTMSPRDVEYTHGVRAAFARQAGRCTSGDERRVSRRELSSALESSTWAHTCAMELCAP